MPQLTDLSYIRRLCKKYGFSFSKSFGQNFILNPDICPRISEEAEIDDQTNVLEIGPGFGTLTRQLAQDAKKVVAIEVDKSLLPVLKETLADTSNVTIINEDVLRCDLEALILEHFSGPVKVCANLPYYITSPILMRLLEERVPVTSITAMVQKEAAQRICAQPGTRQCGAISYATSYYSTPTILFDVKPGNFYPPPKVTSSVIRLEVNKKPILSNYPEKEKNLFKLVKAGFGQRRKTLNNAVSAGLNCPKEQTAAAIARAGLAPMVRAEQLTLEDYVRLEDAVFGKS